jgi:hypothetical protein
MSTPLLSHVVNIKHLKHVGVAVITVDSLEAEEQLLGMLHSNMGDTVHLAMRDSLVSKQNTWRTEEANVNAKNVNAKNVNSSGSAKDLNNSGSGKSRSAKEFLNRRRGLETAEFQQKRRRLIHKEKKSDPLHQSKKSGSNSDPLPQSGLPQSGLTPNTSPANTQGALRRLWSVQDYLPTHNEHWDLQWGMHEKSSLKNKGDIDAPQAW